MAFDDTDAPDDDALVAMFAGGDQSAARLLTHRHARQLIALGQRMLGDRSEAEDVAQEAFLRLWRMAPQWQPGGAQVGTWLYRVANNLCIDRLRKARGEALDEVPEPEDPAPRAEDTLQAQSVEAAIGTALGALPERQQAALRLRFLDERTNPEIAEILEISVDAVESLLARGKRKLAQLLQDQRHDLL